MTRADMTRDVRSAGDRAEAVMRVVHAARRVAEARATIAPNIARSTGLSMEGVERVFERHLELEPTDADIEQLVSRAADAPAVAVILAANVFAGALRAIALARAASDDVVVRPSRRDPVFARALVQAIRDSGDLRVRLDEVLDVASIEHGEVHIYGHDATIATIRSKARAGVRVRGHGSGMGIALVSANADLADASKALAEDVVAFDQRGCLSPRIVLVVGAQERATAFAGALHESLDVLGSSVPRGEMGSEDRAEAGRYVTTMTYAFAALVGAHHAIGIAPAGAPLVLPPAYRHVHVAAVPSLEDATRTVAPLARGIVTVGSDELEASRAVAPTWARLAKLGWMQRPALDGPVDLRTT